MVIRFAAIGQIPLGFDLSFSAERRRKSLWVTVMLTSALLLALTRLAHVFLNMRQNLETNIVDFAVWNVNTVF